MILGSFGGLLLLVLGAIAATIETPVASSQLTDAAGIEPKQVDPDSDPEFFFISKMTGLWQVIKDKNGNLAAEKRAFNGEKAIAMDYHFRKNLLFWSTYDGEIYSCALRGRFAQRNEVKPIVKYGDWYPVAIAVDYINDLLYVIDSKKNTLYIMALDGSTGANLIRSFDPVVGEDFQPRYLEVDPYEGAIFFIDYNNAFNHMYRMDLDGTDPQPINIYSIDREWQTGSFTLDPENKRILVSSPYDSELLSVDYLGENPRKIIGVNNYASTLTVDRKNSYLYFVNVTAYAMNSMQEKVTDIMKTDLYRCNYSAMDNKCADGSIDLIELVNGSEWSASAVLQLKAVAEPKRRVENNSCDKRPCQDMCIYNDKRDKYKCRCKTGYRLTTEGLCEIIDEFLIFENDNSVGGIDVTASKPDLYRSNDEVFTPFQIRMRSNGDDQFGFDYDPLKKQLFYSNIHEVVMKDLNKNSMSVILFDPLRNYGLLAIDSTSSQFYFVEISAKPVDHSIGVTKMLKTPFSQFPDPLYQNVTQRYPIKYLKSGIGQIRSLAVYPALGYVFYVSYDANLKKFQLTRMMVDGSKTTSLYEELGPVNYMALDYEEKKLYYVDDNDFVHRADFNGKNVEKLIPLPMKGSTPLGCINGFSVYGDWLYVKDSNDIRRCNKTISCQQWERYDPKPFNFNMRTQLRFHSTKTSATMPSPCSDKPCHHLCFALPDAEGNLQAQCACSDGFELNSDGRICDRIN